MLRSILYDFLPEARSESYAIRHQDFDVLGRFEERHQLILARVTEGQYEGTKLWETASIKSCLERCSTSPFGVKKPISMNRQRRLQAMDKTLATVLLSMACSSASELTAHHSLSSVTFGHRCRSSAGLIRGHLKSWWSEEMVVVINELCR